MTILKTIRKRRNGKAYIIDQCLGNAHRQDIFFRLNGVRYDGERWWF